MPLHSTSDSEQLQMAVNTVDGAGPPDKILCIEDNTGLCNALASILAHAGFQVTFVHDAGQATAFPKEDIDLILLDLGLPDRDGFDLLAELRQTGDTPIIVLTGNLQQEAKVRGLDLGADDYITKPFDQQEMLARIRSVLRRSARATAIAPTPGDRQEFQGWSICQRQRSLSSPDGVLVNLTVKEFDLLCVFINHAQEVLSRDMLMNAMAGITWDAMDRRIDVLVSRLRKKLAKHSPNGKDLVETVRCAGYRFTQKVRAVSAESFSERVAAGMLPVTHASPGIGRPQ